MCALFRPIYKYYDRLFISEQEMQVQCKLVFVYISNYMHLVNILKTKPPNPQNRNINQSFF